MVLVSNVALFDELAVKLLWYRLDTVVNQIAGITGRNGRSGGQCHGIPYRAGPVDRFERYRSGFRHGRPLRRFLGRNRRAIPGRAGRFGHGTGRACPRKPEAGRHRFAKGFEQHRNLASRQYLARAIRPLTMPSWPWPWLNAHVQKLCFAIRPKRRCPLRFTAAIHYSPRTSFAGGLLRAKRRNGRSPEPRPCR